VLAPKPLRSDLCALGHGPQLEISNIRIDGTETGERAEAAVAARDHSLAPDAVRVVTQTLCNQERVFDVVRRRAQYAGDEDLVLGYGVIAKDDPFVRVARIRTFE
jgi:hypothetical protein